MDSIYYCGLSFCVSYYPERCSVYPDPYYLCSYHGLETDILNLTACWGYELWKFSTTCTLVIESVKATSVIFLLGVGSLVCYKLYSHYRKKPGGPPLGKKLRLLRWGSEELIESNADIDSDLQNIESKYFGPEENNTEDVASEFSDVDTDECSSLSESANLYVDNSEETFYKLSDSQMGNWQCQYEPVLYSIQAGVNIPDSFLSGYHHSTSPLSYSKSIPFSSQSRHNRRPRKFNFGALIAKQYTDDLNNVTTLENRLLKEKRLHPESRYFNDFNNDDWCYGHSRHGSEADIESLGSPSINFGDNDLEDFIGEEDLANSDAASLKANFSPSSLKGRRNLLDRLPPDGADSFALHDSLIKNAPLEDENCDILKKCNLFNDDSFDLENEHLASSLGYQGCLMRDQSFDSDCSDLSLELSLQDNIGCNTVESLDHLLSHIHQIKQSCLSLDADIVNLKVLKKSSSFSTLKSTSDSSENGGSHSGSAMEMVQKHKCRASFKGLLEKNTFLPEITDKSTGSSNLDVPSSSTGNQFSGAQSLEWESPLLKSKETKSFESEKNSTLPPTSNNSFIALDSGSEFGTSLTSESPDIGPRPSSSSASLEWDEEFECNGDDEISNLTLHLSDHGGEAQTVINEFESDRKNLLFEDNLVMKTNVPQTDIETRDKNFLEGLSSSISQERIVPGQSHDCSPVDNISSASEMNQTFNKNITDNATEIGLNIPKTLQSGSLCTYADDSSYDTLKESFTAQMTSSDPQWASTESGFGEGAIVTSLSLIYQDENKESTIEVRKRHHSEENKANRDSAYCDDMDINLPRLLENISEKWDLIHYSETEWKGHTSRAEVIRNGYAAIPAHLGCHHMRRIRGDNYCAIRAALFQVLVQDIPILDNYGGLKNAQKKLETLARGHCSWLQDWSFGNRLPYSKETCIHGFQECLASLHQIVAQVSMCSKKEELLVTLLNSDPDLDVKLMEAVKLLMLISIIKLYDDSAQGKDVPFFSVLLLIRDTSKTPKSFMMNHLNMVGDSGGIEQIEMCLLGYTLGVSLLVVRPSLFGKEDYVCRYPDESTNNLPEIKLIAEDDRHYNIIVS